MSVDQRVREGLHLTSTRLPEPDTQRALNTVTARGRTATRRRGLIAGGLTAAAAAAAVVVAVSVTGGDGTREAPPADDPSPTTSDSTGGDWTLERIRAEGAPVSFLGGAPSGLDTQLYCIGQTIPSGSPCDRYHPYKPWEDQHWALEVTQGGQSALFDVQGTPNAMDFDADSILVQDGTGQAPRFRLLQADGTTVELRMVGGRAPAVPGPDVTLIGDLDVYRHGSSGPDDPKDHLYLVDDRAGTLQPLDVPQDIDWWGPNFDEFLWGGRGCGVVWQGPDGGFDQHDVDCREDAIWLTDPGWNWPGLADWLEPGRMALVEWSDEGPPLVVHASVDNGTTWERIEIEDREWDDTIEQIDEALEDALRPLG